jgi:hypothetical protein
MQICEFAAAVWYHAVLLFVSETQALVVQIKMESIFITQTASEGTAPQTPHLTYHDPVHLQQNQN